MFPCLTFSFALISHSRQRKFLEQNHFTGEYKQGCPRAPPHWSEAYMEQTVQSITEAHGDMVTWSPDLLMSGQHGDKDWYIFHVGTTWIVVKNLWGSRFSLNLLFFGRIIEN